MTSTGERPAERPTPQRIALVGGFGVVALCLLWAPGGPTRYTGGLPHPSPTYNPGSIETVEFGVFGYYSETRPAKPGKLAWIGNLLKEPATSRRLDTTALGFTVNATFAVLAVSAWKLRPRPAVFPEPTTPPTPDPELSP